MHRTLDAIGELERHADSGMFYNWYSPADGSKLTDMARVNEDGEHNPVYPFLSSVDNGWMAAALMVTRTAEPRLAKQANALLEPMDFGFYYDETAANSGGAGLIRGGFWVDAASPELLGAWQPARPGTRRLLHVPLLRQLRVRAAHRFLHRHRARSDPGQALLRPGSHLPRHL